jgi:secreted PhoX family phosphatase
MMRRRDFLHLSGALASGALLGSSLWRTALGSAAPAGVPECQPVTAWPYGPLLDADENGIMLPAGFQSRVIARSGQPVAGTEYVWHPFPDGGATYRAPGGGWIYVSNSEAGGPVGVGAIRFAADGSIVDAYPILIGTIINCAGGSTPWGTWLSCEEYDAGHVWECDPSGAAPGIKRAALGTFKHEAVCADPRGRMLYLTEDVGDGRFYRFRPARWGDLNAGVLEVAAVAADGAVEWLAVPAPNDITTPTRHQVPESTPFRGGEGIVYRRWHVYFTTKGDSRVWDYDTRRQTVRVLYDPLDDPNRQLTGVDNIAVTPGGDLVVAEDGGNMELVVLSPLGTAAPLLRVIGQNGSELAGPAFSRGGDRLYVSSQRGDRLGITYEVTGPFRRHGSHPCAVP